MTEEQKAKQMLQWALQPDPSQTAVDPHGSNGEIPGYEIEKILGQGGMGAVYKARHRELGRVVAIKVFSSTGENTDLFVERLRKEGRMMAQLEHPNVLGIHDAAVTEDGVPYLILEYVDGMDLFDRLQHADTLSEREAIRVASAVCHGLDAVHGLGIVHRDIKPANILLGNDGSIKVSDFGISKDVDDKGGTQLTLTGTTVGTVDYMSPEHSAGQELDSRADIYSVGVMLYEMIAGVTPRGAFEPLSRYGASKPMEKLVMHCLQRDRDARVSSASELAKKLAKVKAQLKTGGMPVWQQVAIGVGAGVVAILLLLLALNFGNSDKTNDGDVAGANLTQGGEAPSGGGGSNEGPFNGDDDDPIWSDGSDNPLKSGDSTKIPESMWDEANWEEMTPIMSKFASLDNVRGIKMDGNSLVSTEHLVPVAFTKLNPGTDFSIEFKWKRYKGNYSIGVFIPTKYGNTVFEMGAWKKNLMGLQGYYDEGRLITMKNQENEANWSFQENLPMYYQMKNGDYNYMRFHVRDDKMVVMMRSAHEKEGEWKRVGAYRLSGKRWQVPGAWNVSEFTTLGFGSFRSAMYMSELKFKKFK